MTSSPTDAERLRDINDEECRRFQVGIELIGKRWSAAILLAVARGSERFTDIRRMVTGITEPVLSQRLRELEKAHLIERSVIPTMPVQISYTASPRGLELLMSVIPLTEWGQKWHSVDATAPPGRADL